ncbi:MAG: sensor histidine kinase [Magnetovibrionaceae bacterium]
MGSPSNASRASEPGSDAIFVTDSDCRIVGANNQAEILCGRVLADVKQACISSVFEGVEKGRLTGAIHDVVAMVASGSEPKPRLETDLKLLGVDGQEVDAICTDLPLAGHRFVQVALRDVSAYTDFEKTLRDAKVYAEEASRSKSEFMAVMGHELRTPLNAIIGYCDIMKREMFGPLGSPQYVSYLTDILCSGQRLLDLVSDILDIANAAGGKIKLREELFEPALLLNALSESFREAAEEKQVVVRYGADIGPLRIRGDLARLTQAVGHIVGNAIKFSGEGGAVDVTLGRQEDGGLSMIVADQGIGMTEEGIAQGLAMFSQVDSRLARKYEGAGIGLPLARLLLEAHDGGIELESTPGKGTRVSLYLPPDRLTA